MCFDGALGDIQVAGDFRVVASLQQQIDDLALAGSHLIKLLFHEPHLSCSRPAGTKECSQTSGDRSFGWQTACTRPLGAAGVNKM